MACCKGKLPGMGGGDGSIPCEMKELKVEGVDKFFASAADFLGQLEDFRADVFDSKEIIYSNTGMEFVKEPSLGLAVKTALVTIATEMGDAGDKLVPKITMSSPFVDIAVPDTVSKEMKETLEQLKTMVTAIVEAPTKVPELVESAKKVVEDAGKIKDTAADDLKAAGLKPLEMATAMKNLAQNIKTLVDGVAKFGSAFNPSTLAELAGDLKSLVENVPGMMKDVPDLREKAAEAEAKTASDIAQKVMPGDKFTAAEAEANEKKTGGKDKLSKRLKKREDRKAGKKAEPASAEPASGDAAEAAGETAEAAAEE